MYGKNDIIFAVDYHDERIVARRFNCNTGEERLVRCRTRPDTIARLVTDAVEEARPVGGEVIWLMESTTGWARVKALLGSRAGLVLANVLQIPLPPKARRKKTDKIDTARLLREFLNGTLPVAFQPSVSFRQLRRLASARESLVSRRTAVRNWINRYLAHETWESRKGLWSAKGMLWLKQFACSRRGSDRVVLSAKLSELEQLEELLAGIEAEILLAYEQLPDAQRVDSIYGIAKISSVSIVARIGPAGRFANAEELISFAGLAPGIYQSDNTRRDGHIGGGGTDKHLRHYIIEATIWARRIPRYQATYQRASRRRGKKIARLVVARLLLRSIYKMLRDGVEFDRLPAASE